MKVEISNKEGLREAVLRYLYDRQIRAPWTVQAMALHIRNQERVDFDFDEDDIAEACAFLEGIGFALRVERQMGTAIRFKITAQGILYHERQRTQ